MHGDHDNPVHDQRPGRLTNMPTGIFHVGTGKYRDNLTAGVTTLAVGGTDAGGNN
jgi:hypothetical protein